MRGWITLIVFFLIAVWIGNMFPSTNLIGRVTNSGGGMDDDA